MEAFERAQQLVTRIQNAISATTVAGLSAQNAAIRDELQKYRDNLKTTPIFSDTGDDADSFNVPAQKRIEEWTQTFFEHPSAINNLARQPDYQQNFFTSLFRWHSRFETEPRSTLIAIHKRAVQYRPSIQDSNEDGTEPATVAGQTTVFLTSYDLDELESEQQSEDISTYTATADDLAPTVESFLVPIASAGDAAEFLPKLQKSIAVINETLQKTTKKLQKEDVVATPDSQITAYMEAAFLRAAYRSSPEVRNAIDSRAKSGPSSVTLANLFTATAEPAVLARVPKPGKMTSYLRNTNHAVSFQTILWNLTPTNLRHRKFQRACGQIRLGPSPPKAYNTSTSHRLPLQRSHGSRSFRRALTA